MVNKTDADIINRLRGVGAKTSPATAEANKIDTSANVSGSEKNMSALSDLLSSTQDSDVSEAEKKYTMKDLDDFLDNFIKNQPK